MEFKNTMLAVALQRLEKETERVETIKVKNGEAK